MKKHFLTSAKTALVLVYLVILAGALVRMTGSGMGCPDWPKCFGYYIPPTQEKELLFTPGKAYEKGQVIIKDESLLVATADFTATTDFQPGNWEKYTKHDYAIFNPMHTWIEYINRLFGALAGLACFVVFVLSFGFWKSNKKLILISFLVCLLMGFQAWLGKTVVDSVLSPVKITTHMLVALLIVAFQLLLIFWVKDNPKKQFFDNKFKWYLLMAICFTIVQVILGTGVREHVDHIAESGAPKIMWLQNPTLQFYFHRTFSIAILLANGFLFLRNRRMQLGYSKIDWVMGLLGFEILTGLLMYYCDFPLGTQTAHLLMATILFGLQFYMVLEARKKQP